MGKDEGERRLAAILSADVAGYSRLMGDDERATVRTLTDYRKVFSDHIERHKGRVVDTAGDSVLAVFGSVVEAVQCAVNMQSELATRNSALTQDRQMHFRIGINLGDVIEQDDGTIYGDGVNIAARLESLARPGGITVSGTAFDHAENKLSVAFEFTGEQAVKNIAKPVRVYRLLREGEFGSRSQKTNPARRRALDTAVALALPTGPSIAVLPFENMSGDPEQEYFSDGLTEDIITRLTRFPEFFVIARNSTSQYKGQAVDVREVGRNLGAKYVIEGSVRKSGDKIRVTVQLLEAEHGTHVWAETYDRDLTAANIFEIQDEITNSVSATIADERGILWDADRRAIRDKPTNDLDAYECVLRAVAYYDSHTPDAHLEARNCLERAVETDPNYVSAWNFLAFMYLEEERFGFNPRPKSLERALAAARHAAQLDSDDASTHEALALVYYHQHDLERFRAEGERAVALNPNNATILANIGAQLVQIGEFQNGSEMIRKAAALNPYHPGWYYLPLTFAEYQEGNFDKALGYALKINLPGFYWNQVHLAVAYGQLGRQEEGRAAIDKLLELYPDFAKNAWDEYRKFNIPDTLIRRHNDGLRKAGLDIPDEPAAAD